MVGQARTTFLWHLRQGRRRWIFWESRERESEQGTAIWNPQLASRTTFLFAGPNFGAHGYVSDKKYYMLIYFSDSVYENSQANIRLFNLAPRWSPQEDTVSTMRKRGSCTLRGRALQVRLV